MSNYVWGNASFEFLDLDNDGVIDELYMFMDYDGNGMMDDFYGELYLDFDGYADVNY